MGTQIKGKYGEALSNLILFLSEAENDTHKLRTVSDEVDKELNATAKKIREQDSKRKQLKLQIK